MVDAQEKLNILELLKTGKIEDAFIKIKKSIESNEVSQRYNIQQEISEKYTVPPSPLEVYLLAEIDFQIELLMDSLLDEKDDIEDNNPELSDEIRRIDKKIDELEILKIDLEKKKEITEKMAERDLDILNTLVDIVRDEVDTET